MKKSYLLLMAFLLSCAASAQIITFADPAFKSTLLYASETHNIATGISTNDWIVVDTNGDNEIDVTEAQNVKSIDLFFWGGGVSSLGGIEYFTNIESIRIDYNTTITTVDFTALTHLKNFQAEGCHLTGALDFSHCPDLRSIYCPDNQITSLDLTGVNLLENLDLTNNLLTSLEIHSHSEVGGFSGEGLQLECSYNQLTELIVEGRFGGINASVNYLTTVSLAQCHGGGIFGLSSNFAGNMLTGIYLKNGSGDSLDFFYAENFPFLEYICCDANEINYFTAQLLDQNMTNVELNTFCSVQPGGNYFTVQGAAHVDSNNNGCDASDPAYPFLHFDVQNQLSEQSTYSANGNGNYALWLPAGEYTITPQITNAAYFTLTPANLPITLGTQTEPVLQDFCITPNGSHPDVSVSLFALQQARPGFDVTYKLVYQNVGSTVLSGTVHLSFEDDVTDLVSAAPAVSLQQIGELNWDFTGLEPFETRQIVLTLNLNSPVEMPALNSGDMLNFTASANIETDEDLSNNTALLSQNIVNSLDPNDKTCLEGDHISLDEAGDYVHYMIRFENTGTADAIHVFVRDIIDAAQFDVASLVPLQGSHPYFTRIDGNRVEFVFENINLPFDDAHNDGFVVFKIRTNPSLQADETFSNTASIFFDYNHPIVTNTATTILTVLKNQDFEFSDSFAIYPNPTKNTLHIESKNQTPIVSLEVFNTLGQLVISVPNAGGLKTVDVSDLQTGNYFLKVVSEKGTSHTQFIKQ